MSVLAFAALETMLADLAAENDRDRCDVAEDRSWTVLRVMGWIVLYKQLR